MFTTKRFTLEQQQTELMPSSEHIKRECQIGCLNGGRSVFWQIFTESYMVCSAVVCRDFLYLTLSSYFVWILLVLYISNMFFSVSLAGNDNGAGK